MGFLRFEFGMIFGKEGREKLRSEISLFDETGESHRDLDEMGFGFGAFPPDSPEDADQVHG